MARKCPILPGWSSGGPVVCPERPCASCAAHGLTRKQTITADDTAANLLPDYTDTMTTAAFLKISPFTLICLYSRREGPPVIRYGRKVVYRCTRVVSMAELTQRGATPRKLLERASPHRAIVFSSNP